MTLPQLHSVMRLIFSVSVLSYCVVGCYVKIFWGKAKGDYMNVSLKICAWVMSLWT
jgi:hypothetical protein